MERVRDLQSKLKEELLPELKLTVGDAAAFLQTAFLSPPVWVIIAQYLGVLLKYVISLVSVIIQLFSVNQLTSCSYAGIPSSLLQVACNVQLPNSTFYQLVFISAGSLYFLIAVVSIIISQRRLLMGSAKSILLVLSVLGMVFVVTMIVAATASLQQSLAFLCSGETLDNQPAYIGVCSAPTPSLSFNQTTYTVPCVTACGLKLPREMVQLQLSIALTHFFVIVDLVRYYVHAKRHEETARAAKSDDRDTPYVELRRPLMSADRTLGCCARCGLHVLISVLCRWGEI
jgi:hypothetical protein